MTVKKICIWSGKRAALLKLQAGGLIELFD